MSDLRKQRRIGEEGASIVAVLVAIAVIGIVAIGYAGSSAKSMKAVKLIEEKDTVRNLENAIVDELYLVLQELNKSNCLNAAAIKKRSFGFGDAASNLRQSTNIGKDKGVMKSNAAGPAERCGKHQFISPANIASAANNRLYFCLAVDNPSKVKNKARSFVEVSLDFRNTVDSLAVSCKQFLEDPATIARINYAFYLSDYKNDPHFTRKLGATIVPGGGMP